MTHTHLKIIASLLLLLLGCAPSLQAKLIKVLAIGNSFSQDAVEEHLYQLAAAQGDSLVIGNAYIPGCSIDRHWNNAQKGTPDYSYRKIIGGKRTERKKVALEEMIRDEAWDIITLQQASHYSGMVETYGHLGDLIDYVKHCATGKDVKIAFHMTWAYQQDSSHKGFKQYGNDQHQMYRAICQAVKQATTTHHIRKIIPAGVTIQYARAALSDTLTRDGYHLAIPTGRYAAACTWCRCLTGKKLRKNTYLPAGMTAETARIIRRAADEAVSDSKKIF